MSVNRRSCSLVILLTLAGSFPASAQIRSATITGAVTDPTKAVIPGATVVVINQDTNSRTELVTNGDGLFTAPLLPAGTYTVEVSLPGFAHFRRTGTPGMGNSNSYGTRGMATFNPRQIQLRTSLRF